MRTTALAISAIVLALVATNVPAQSYPEGMLCYWKLDEGIGTTAHDSAGDSEGAIYGATWIDGVAGKALQFDGPGVRGLGGRVLPKTYACLGFKVRRLGIVGARAPHGIEPMSGAFEISGAEQGTGEIGLGARVTRGKLKCFAEGFLGSRRLARL